jgi:hypothetical protein
MRPLAAAASPCASTACPSITCPSARRQVELVDYSKRGWEVGAGGMDGVREKLIQNEMGF